MLFVFYNGIPSSVIVLIVLKIKIVSQQRTQFKSNFKESFFLCKVKQLKI